MTSNKQPRKPKIVFLDAGTVDWGDLSLKSLKALGTLRTYSFTRSADILNRVGNAQIVITNKCRFDRATLKKLKNLRSLHVTATGVNNVDLEAAKQCGVAVTNVKGYSTETVVQFTFAFILALAGSVVDYGKRIQKGEWVRSPFFTLPGPIMELVGKNLGVVGYGTIGKRVAQVAKALGMKVLIAKLPGRKYSKKENQGRVSLGRLLQEADVVTVHAPLTPKMLNLIDARGLRKMKRRAFLVNMARGGIVNELALARALKRGMLAGAAADVLTSEPPARNHPLLKAPRFLMTPHVAWASVEARERLMQEVVLNIQSFQRGKKRNRVV